MKPSASKWWPSYDQETVALIEEFQSCFPLTTLLQLAEEYAFRVEYKGGYYEFNSPVIILTSNTSPEEQYPEVSDKRPATHAAYMRRMQFKYCTTGRTYDQIEHLIQSSLLRWLTE